jgi:hypothetical protein
MENHRRHSSKLEGFLGLIVAGAISLAIQFLDSLARDVEAYEEASVPDSRLSSKHDRNLPHS